MTAVTGRAAEYGVAFRNHKDLSEQVIEMRDNLFTKEEELRKAEMRLNQAKRTLLEEAQLT